MIKLKYSKSYCIYTWNSVVNFRKILKFWPLLYIFIYTQIYVKENKVLLEFVILLLKKKRFFFFLPRKIYCSWKVIYNNLQFFRFFFLKKLNVLVLFFFNICCPSAWFKPLTIIDKINLKLKKKILFFFKWSFTYKRNNNLIIMI